MIGSKQPVFYLAMFAHGADKYPGTEMHLAA